MHQSRRYPYKGIGQKIISIATYLERLKASLQLSLSFLMNKSSLWSSTGKIPTIINDLYHIHIGKVTSLAVIDGYYSQ